MERLAPTPRPSTSPGWKTRGASCTRPSHCLVREETSRRLRKIEKCLVRGDAEGSSLEDDNAPDGQTEIGALGEEQKAVPYRILEAQSC